MKRMMFAVVLLAMITMASCEVTSAFKQSYAEDNLPLVTKKIAMKESFSSIANYTVIDIVYKQDSTELVELVCPEECSKHIEIKVENGNMAVSLDSKLSDSERNVLSRKLSRSKLYVTSVNLTKVVVNGSSSFVVNGDLYTDEFLAQLNGSGDVSLNGVQCAKGDFYVSVNGSGDVIVSREVKAKTVNVNVNGSGDVKCEMLTAYNVVGQVNGSGDVVMSNVLAVKSQFGVNGSGDVKTNNIECDIIIATMTGSGDVVMSGKCESATLSLIGSGDISAKMLEAQDVDARVTHSGDITCNAQRHLTAKVTGSGCVGYKGNPQVVIEGDKDNVYKL